MCPTERGGVLASSSLPSATNRHPDDWKPNSGPQADFLTRTCFEALYGGAAGGGKSDALLVDALRYLGRGYGKNYHAILFRRTFPELEKSLILRAWDLYPRLGGHYNEQKKRWRFPGGEIVEFAHLEHAQDVHAYQGAAFQYIAFDELTSFLEAQYVYLFSRARSAHGIPCRIRGGTNPGGVGHAWVFSRWGAWLDPSSEVSADPGQTLYFARDNDGECVVPKGTPLSLGRTFIPALLEDNPHLAADGKYAAALQALDPVTRERLRSGNWLIQPDAYLFRDTRFYEELPTEGYRLSIGIDFAYTEKKRADWSAAIVLLECAGNYYVIDVVRMQVRAPRFRRRLRTLQAEYPGARMFAYVSTTERGVAELMGDDVDDPTEEGEADVQIHWKNAVVDKYARAQPTAAAWNGDAEVGRPGCIFVPRQAPWLAEFTREVASFTGVKDAHDDQVDALVAAFDGMPPEKPASPRAPRPHIRQPDRPG